MTKISEMDPKICAIVCTMFAKGCGCQAPRTNYLNDLPKDACQVGKGKASEWLRKHQK